VGGPRAAQAEVVLGDHQPGAHELLPPAVHGDALDQGVARVHEPAGEVEPVLDRARRLSEAVEGGGDAGGDGLARIEE